MALSLVTPPATEPLTVSEVKAHLRLDASDGEPAPIAATVALAGAGSGNCDNGAWRIGFTFVTADGETELGLLSAAVTVVDKTTNGKIAVTNVPIGGSLVTARNAYAIPPAGSAALYVGQIANNTASTYTVNIAASALGVQAPTTNTTLDPQLVAWIVAARQFCETYTHRAFITQTLDLMLDGFPYWSNERLVDAGAIWIPKAPLVSVTSISYVDTAGATQTWGSSNYTVDAPTGPEARQGRIVPAYSIYYPVTRAVPNAVTVRFVAGYGAASAVPYGIKAAMKLLIGSWWQNRESVIVSHIVAELPMGVAALLWPFKSF